MRSIRSDDLQTSTVHLGFRLTCNQWVLVRTKPISAEHHNVYILPLFFIAWLVARSLRNWGDAICFELALAWKEVVGCSQNQSERTWEASPYGSADFRNQSWSSRCLIKKKENMSNTLFCPEECSAQPFPCINPTFFHVSTNNRKSAYMAYMKPPVAKTKYNLLCVCKWAPQYVQPMLR